jgi:hypothetical protein
VQDPPLLEPLLTSDEAEKGEEDDDDDEDADEEEEHIELTDFEARWRSHSARFLAVSDAHCAAVADQDASFCPAYLGRWTCVVLQRPHVRVACSRLRRLIYRLRRIRVDAISAFGNSIHVPGFYVAFVITPVVSNASGALGQCAGRAATQASQDTSAQRSSPP